jgi:hypothetical protein
MPAAAQASPPAVPAPPRSCRDMLATSYPRQVNHAYLRSLPRANWSLALEHSFSRPAFSHAVQAGSLPSHLMKSFSTNLFATCPGGWNQLPSPSQLDLDTSISMPCSFKKKLHRKNGHSHLEHADTGRETRSNGFSEKLDRGILVFSGRLHAVDERSHLGTGCENFVR